MNRLFALLLSVLVLTCFVSAQSGRRVKAAPTPEAVTEDSPDQYSESKPLPKRIIPPTLIRETRSETAQKDPTPAEAPTTATEGDVVKVDTDLVTIPVSVYDRNGVYVPNLRQNDFKIFEDGKEQEIAYFGRTDVPFTVVLLIDTSPSTEYKIDEIRDAARSFVDKLSQDDTVMVVAFASNVRVLCEPTKDRQVMYKAIDKADFGNGTLLYDAVDYSLRKRMNQIQGRKAIVLFTDGVDTTSRKSSYDKTLAVAEESDSIIFPIYYNTYFDLRGMTGATLPPVFGQQRTNAPGSEEYALGKRYLEDLAAYTGGRVFRPESGGLNAAFEGIAEELRSQYSIGFIPRDEGKPGQRKALKVRVNMPNVAVRARDSYVVPAKGS
jgi:VWFA-related protein